MIPFHIQICILCIIFNWVLTTDYSCFVAEMISWLKLDFVDSGMLLIPQKLVVDEKIISVVAGSLFFNWNASVKYMRIFIAAHCLSVLGWRDWGFYMIFLVKLIIPSLCFRS